MSERCENCEDGELLPQYGVGPHICYYRIPNAKIGQSINTFDVDNWPDGFLIEILQGDTPQSLKDGHSTTGVYVCTECNSLSRHAKALNDEGEGLLTKEMYLNWRGEHQPKEADDVTR